ncbi:MAG TPA: S8 family serine peptidase [Thermoanaerobaculia bacterium]|nr:S8 family serine peptidase [Thermoanaerobaculia bacterium]
MRQLLPLLLAAFAVAPVSADSGRYLVAVRHPAAQADLRILRDSGEARAHAVRSFVSVDGFAADLSAEDVAALRRSPEVRFVSPVVERHVLENGGLSPAADASAFDQAQTIPYGVAMVHAPEVWPVTKGRGPVNVAILDTGIDMHHPDLAENYAGGTNAFAGTDDPTDDNGHGTHVAGTIAARDNGIGVIGVAPEARVWAVKVLNKAGAGSDETIIAGIDWVMARKREVGGDWIISMSLGSVGPSGLEESAVEAALAQGIVVVAAAGNSASEHVEYPGAYPGVINVGAVDEAGDLAAFSDHGPLLIVVAPGVQVLSTTIVGSVDTVTVRVGDSSIPAATVEGSAKGEIKGPYFLCGLGEAGQFPPEVAGNIAVIERGDITFNEKVRNAQAAHAAAVLIYNRDDTAFNTWTLLRPDCSDIAGCDDPTHSWPVVLAVSAEDGQRLASAIDRTMDMGTWLDDYRVMSGTSMSTPHVSGILALLWSLVPSATPADLRDALISTATDLGAPGVDDTFGHGLVDAQRAAMKLAPWAFTTNRGHGENLQIVRP